MFAPTLAILMHTDLSTVKLAQTEMKTCDMQNLSVREQICFLL